MTARPLFCAACLTLTPPLDLVRVQATTWAGKPVKRFLCRPCHEEGTNADLRQFDAEGRESGTEHHGPGRGGPRLPDGSG